MSVEPAIRVTALHALPYCKRLFYLEEVEGIRVADFAVFAEREPTRKDVDWPDAPSSHEIV